MDIDRPTDPTDTRWLPSRWKALLIGAAIQLILAAWGGWYLFTPQPQPAKPRQLVNEVLIPEDMVYPDTDQGIKIGKKLPSIDLKEVAAASPAQLKAGADIFAQNCVSCHGLNGKGDGPAGITLNPGPRDLTALNTWKNGTRTSDIFRTISLGSPGTRMSAFDFLSPGERLALAHFVESLAPGHARDTAESLQSLDRQFNLSQGVTEPSTIPVSTAMDKLVAEAAAAARAAPNPDAVDPAGAQLFREVADSMRVSSLDYWLSHDSSWMKDPARLRILAVGGSPTNGFLPRVGMLDEKSWGALHRYLLVRYQKKPEQKGQQ
jgi:mono/diheme cytochrome c family protein